VKGLRRSLLDWYRANRRDLPWRATRDPYAIWISEAMLQQTRVETAIPYYERFLARFPDLQTLADADSDEVLGVWAGLGYYSRARNLHAAARIVVDEHAGELPDDAEALRSLPGVGRYTAGAVASIAFDRPEPVVDGNVSRVFARLRGIRDDVRKAATVRRLWEEAAALVRGPHPGDLNQALMELGARVCTPRAPRCPVCPVAHHCEAHRGGDAEALPVQSEPAEPRRVEAVAALVLRRGRALAVRRPSGLLAGLWDLPGGELSRGERPATGVKRALRERVGLTITRVQRAGVVKHAFSHRLLHLVVYRCDTPQGRVRLSDFDGHRWLAPKSFARLPQAAVTRKALDLVLERTPAGPAGSGSR
jgi:A/G-specific adenine glycosylase